MKNAIPKQIKIKLSKLNLNKKKKLTSNEKFTLKKVNSLTQSRSSKAKVSKISVLDRKSAKPFSHKDDSKKSDLKKQSCKSCWFSKKWNNYSQNHMKELTFEDIKKSGIETAFHPIFVCFLLVLISLHILPYFQTTFNLFDVDEFKSHMLPADDIVPDSEDKVRIGEPIMNFEVEPEKKVSRPGTIIVIVAGLLVLLALLTFGMVYLYKRGCYQVIYGLFFVAFIFYLGLFPIIWIQEFVYFCNLATDWPLLVLTIYNFLALGMITLFDSGPKKIKKFYNIITCVIVVFFLIKWCNLWIEITLLLTVVFWDMFAVLHKNGPLNQLLDHMKENSVKLPPIVFETAIWLAANPRTQENKKTDNLKVQSTTSNYSSTKENQLQIGLGDFVFFSLLVGKSYLYANYLGAYLTMVALFFGLTVTIILLLVCDHPLPALPIPILFGLFTQLLSQCCVDPFVTRLNARMFLI